MRSVALLLCLTSTAAASPWDLSLGSGAIRVDATTATHGGGGFGYTLDGGLSRRITPGIAVGVRFGFRRFWPEELRREGRILSAGLHAELEVLPRFFTQLGTALVIVSTTPHELSMSRGLAIPLRASYEFLRRDPFRLRAGIETQPTFFRGGFVMTSMLVLEYVR